MCTVSWWRDDAGAFGVFFNRDELRSRPASAPVHEARAADATPYLAPLDTAAGGSWIMANARGLVVGILNHYAAASAWSQIRPECSRGLLPLGMTACGSRDDVEQHLAHTPLRDFAPFILLAWDGDGETGWTWDGLRRAAGVTPSPPVTTSSHRAGEVCAWRRARYRELVRDATPGALAAYHDDIAHPDPAFNVRMRRPDARTESCCRVTVTPEEVRFVHRREAVDALAAMDTTEAVLARGPR